MSNVKQAPRLGIISDTLLQRHVLHDVAKNYGIEVLVQMGPEKIDEQWLISEELDAWIVDISSEELWVQALEQVLDRVKAPLLFCDGSAPVKGGSGYPQWERRIYSKLKNLLLLEAPAETSESLNAVVSAITDEKVTKIQLPKEFKGLTINAAEPVEHVYLLIASLGGPAAVKLFLDSLPAGLPVAFIYAQHIDKNCQHLLPQVIGRHSHYKLRVGEQNEVLRYGDVIIAPIENEITLSDKGVVEVKDVPWAGPYSPSFDQVMNNLSVVYEANISAIIFSGMGNDGAIAGPALTKRGGTVWAQTSQTCACSSMPDALRETGCVSFSGTPQQLAQQLVKAVQKNIAATHITATGV